MSFDWLPNAGLENQPPYRLIPVAAGVIYPAFGRRLSPIFAGAAMAMSSVSVITNALRLNRVKL